MMYCDERYHMAHFTADGQLRPERHFRMYSQDFAVSVKRTHTMHITHI
jgi:hypothetical protein